MESGLVPNCPALWRQLLPRPEPGGHKYDRGHAVILGAPTLTGATRLAAQACSRIGAGLVTVMADGNDETYRMTLAPDIMVVNGGLERIRGANVVLAGPGGVAHGHAALLSGGRSAMRTVCDASAIDLFLQRDGAPSEHTSVLTPHAGEFARCFPGLEGAPAQRAVRAAAQAGAVIVLKGASTVIASPQGRLCENRHASPYLAKAGTGDVLAGMIAGLLAQGMASFEASCAAVWMHGEASLRIGPGLIAGDIEGEIAAILRALLEG